MKNVILFALLFIISCGSNSNNQTNGAPIYMPDTSLGITAVPSSLGSDYRNNFDRYTKITAPNGKSIDIVAQNTISNEKMVRARSIMEHYLTNLAGSAYGADKSAITNQIADNKCTLLLLNGKDDGTNPAANLNGQPLYNLEIQVEGDSWYINQNYEYRDASFEEILHLIHDCGIGVDGSSTPGVLKTTYQAEIRSAQQNALTNNLWGIGASSWITELTNENSLTQEYLAAVIDVFYGLWGASTQDGTRGMNGLYITKNRAGILLNDPQGNALVSKFFHNYLTYNARIDSSFTGTFRLDFDASVPYTNTSQYLKNITLLGNNNINVKINGRNNDITGNSGENTVIVSGIQADYSVNTNNGVTTLTDNIANRDGVNTLRSIEKVQFTDTTISL